MIFQIYMNIKTPEQYTQVTKNAMNKIKSPLDKLDLKDEKYSS